MALGRISFPLAALLALLMLDHVFVTSPLGSSEDSQAADISDALVRAVAAVRVIPDESSRVLPTRAIGLAQVRVLLKQGDLETARKEAAALVYGFRDQALMSVALTQVGAGDVDGALVTAADVGGAYSRGAPVAYVAWALARRGDVGRAREIARTIRIPESRVLAFGDIAVTQAEAGDPSGAIATVGEMTAEVDRAAALADIALVRFHAGDRSNATATLAQAVSIVRSAPPSPGRNYAFMATALVYAQMREFASALSLTAQGDPHSRWLIAIAQAAAGDARGALKTDGSIARKGYLAAALAEGGHLDEAREALTCFIQRAVKRCRVSCR